MDMNKIYYLILAILIIVIGTLVLVLCLPSKHNTIIYSTGGSFENQWIKFNYPPELTIDDASNNNHIQIKIYNETEMIGAIFDDGININRYALSDTNLTTINGRKTLKEYEYDIGSEGEHIIKPSAAIYLSEDSTLNIIFEPKDRNIFNQIMDNLTIKKDNTTVNSHQRKENNNFKKFPLSTGGTFENQWVKFNYPSNLTVSDSSTDNHIQISLFNETILVGDITVSEGKVSERSDMSQNQNIFSITDTAPTDMDIQSNIIKIAGRNAKNNTQTTGNFQPMPSAVIELNSNAMLEIAFQPGTETAYNQVINTIIIKKDNIHPSLQSDIYYYFENWVDFIMSIIPF